jgi:hypothetical protein
MRLIDSVAVALTPPNLAGLAWTVFRIGRLKTISAGEMLWAWSGIAWSTLLVANYTHDNVGLAKHLASLGVVSAIAASLAVFGPRPPKHGVMWAHLTGWLLLECDVIFWGLITWT